MRAALTAHVIAFPLGESGTWGSGGQLSCLSSEQGNPSPRTGKLLSGTGAAIAGIREIMIMRPGQVFKCNPVLPGTRKQAPGGTGSAIACVDGSSGSVRVDFGFMHKTTTEGERIASRPLAVTYRATASLKPDPRNARTHSMRQVEQIVASIREFGFTNPILLDPEGSVI